MNRDQEFVSATALCLLVLRYPERLNTHPPRHSLINTATAGDIVGCSPQVDGGQRAILARLFRVQPNMAEAAGRSSPGPLHSSAMRTPVLELERPG
jgi:hypothetical protein